MAPLDTSIVTLKSSHSPYKFMHDLYIAEIYRPGAVFSPLIGPHVGGSVFIHYTASSEKSYIG